MNKHTTEPRAPGKTGVASRLARRPARIPSRVVLGGDSEVVIVHGTDEYLLRVGDDGNLILSR